MRGGGGGGGGGGSNKHCLLTFFLLHKNSLGPANFVCGGYTVFTLSVRACVRVCVRPYRFVSLIS